MGKGIKEEARAQELEPVSLSELIHQHVRAAIETAVNEELRVALTLPRATLFSGAGDVKEWTSRIVPRDQRRIPDVNEAVIATYLAGGNTRRIRGALQPLLELCAGECRRRCWRSSTAMPGCGAPSGSSGPRLRSNRAACTSCATLSARRRSTRWRKSVTTSIASSTRRMPTPPAPPTRPLSAHETNAVRAS
jgi:hypothetical protein